MNKSCLWLSWSPGLKRNARNEWFCRQKTATFWSYLTNPAAPPCRRLVYRRLSQTHLLWGPIDHCNRGHEEGMFYLIGNCFSIWAHWNLSFPAHGLGLDSIALPFGKGLENEEKVLMINITPFDKAIDGPLSQSSDFWVFVFLTLNTNTHGMWTMSKCTRILE